MYFVFFSQCDSLERDLLEKDSSISTIKTHLASLKAEHAGSSSTITHLEATIRDKDKHIEILQSQRQRSGEETDEELSRVKRAHEKLEGRLTSLREQLSDKEVHSLVHRALPEKDVIITIPRAVPC